MSRTNRYLEAEFEDSRKRLDFKRQRQMQEQLQRRLGKSDCEVCMEEFCCGAASPSSRSPASPCWKRTMLFCCCFCRCCGCDGCYKRCIGEGNNQEFLQEQEVGQDPEMLEANLDANGGGGGPTISMLLYSIFPAFAVIDLLLGQLAKELGWYSECIAERVCGWSMTACAFWIALTLSGVGVAACTAFSRIAAAARRKGWPCCGDAGDEAGRSAASIGGRSRGPSPQKAGTGNRPYWEAARREGKMATASVGGSTYHLARSGGGGGNSNGGSSSGALLSGNRADSRRSASAPPAEMRRSAARAAGAGGRHHARANVPSIEIVIA